MAGGLSFSVLYPVWELGVTEGLANLGACQALCESTASCKGVEYHTSGRCEIWTRAGGIESSISRSLKCLSKPLRH